MTDTERKQAIAAAKTTLRRKLANIRAAVPDRVTKQAALTRRLLDAVSDCGTIFCYVSMGSEAETHAFIRAVRSRCTVVVPHVYPDGSMFPVVPDSDKLIPDRWGNVGGQAYTGPIELAVVPMLGFNTRLYRIGYGKGCYDRWLSDNPVPTLGLAFDEQQIDFNPEDHDRPLDRVLTPTRILTRELKEIV